jgi:hypothetical protein
VFSCVIGSVRSRRPVSRDFALCTYEAGIGILGIRIHIFESGVLKSPAYPTVTNR